MVLSWYGYHRSIVERPIQLENIFGQSRFFIDIGILSCYWFLIEKSANLWFILLNLGIIWSLYMIWIIFEELEHGEGEYRANVKFATSLGFLATFWTLFCVYHFAWGIGGTQTINFWDWIFISLAIATVVMYRIVRKAYA